MGRALTTGEIKHSLDVKRIEDTPLAGRNFLSLVEQIPGFQNAPWIGSSNNPTNSTGSYASFSRGSEWVVGKKTPGSPAVNASR